MNINVGGVAFDLDGTLYPNYRLYIRLVPFILKEHRLLLAFGKARTALRREAARNPGVFPLARSFYDEQARYAAAALGGDAEAAKERIETLIYRGWGPLFHRIRPFRYVRQTLEDLRKRGFKLGLLSDFPPETKLRYMGLDSFWDTLLCSEVLGRLKPDPLPFRELAARMALPPERILYVGNSTAYDIAGAKRAGMKAALIRPSWSWGSHGGADFVFSSYRQLAAFMVSSSR